jgi:hypothetical protein
MAYGSTLSFLFPFFLFVIQKVSKRHSTKHDTTFLHPFCIHPVHAKRRHSVVVVVVTFLPPKAEDYDADDPPRDRKEASRAGKDDDKDKPFDDEGTHFQTKRRLKAGLQAEKQYFERTV